jgi:hypothetical protein
LREHLSHWIVRMIPHQHAQAMRSISLLRLRC